MTDQSMNDKIISNMPKFFSIYNTINTNINHYVEHAIFNEQISLNPDTISIVMTTHDRIQQTITTLNTIEASSYKNIQVIIVDDSWINFIPDNKLRTYPFRIDYIKIKKENRDWINPCVNYNIAFKYIKGSLVIIQNAEVCHIGDVIKYVKDNCQIGTYLVFDVLGMGSFKHNRKLYSAFHKNGYGYNSNIKMLLKMRHTHWNQHHIHRPAMLNHLTAIHSSDLAKMGSGFDYDFAMGRWRDDREFIFRIIEVLKLNVVQVKHDVSKSMGVHQHHNIVLLNDTRQEYKKSIKLNMYIYDLKFSSYMKKKHWPFLFESAVDEKNTEFLTNA